MQRNLIAIFVFICLLIWAGAYEMETLSSSPRIYLIKNLISPEECDTIMKLAAPSLRRSTVLSAKEEGAIDPRRSSYGMFFPSRPSHPVLKSLEQVASELTGLPIGNGEGLQVLRYNVGGEYQPHFDYFDASQPGGAETLKRGGQRVATLIVYLNTVAAGGETIFPKARVSVKPVKGNAVLFYNVDPSGAADPMSFHGGAPVKEGEKWIITKWMREGTFR